MKFVDYICLGLLLISPMAVCADTELSVGIDSKYVTEGRNNLSLGGIFWTNINYATSENWALHVTYGVSTDAKVSYDELNVTIAYQNTVNEVNYVIGLTQIKFFKDKTSDTEISFETIAYQDNFISPYISVVYSMLQAGFFGTGH
ncbi:hypothetical protein RS130_16025 [Paraglaciecola aquimarina]|uniref:DUF3078 domain-containing protein n=1 Tax=Paraglaciecola aquimarina TaxID=1235557 RepID=A0ABU3SYY1_9ALTE|nr:hypothetical protein [Paraglaciecola aquimarina]MDU0355205.1 hypothetical protein [Paraglaciecola aquimarina]